MEYSLDRSQMTLLPRYNLRSWGGQQGVGGTRLVEWGEVVKVCHDPMGEGNEELLDEGLGKEFEFAEDLFCSPAEKRRPRAEKRRARHAYGLERAKERGGLQPAGGLDITREELQQLQEMDGDLAKSAEGR